MRIMANLLIFSMFAFGGVGSSEVNRTSDGYVALRVPGYPLEKKDIQRRLFSGLTTTIKFDTEAKNVGSGDKVLGAGLLEIRYDIWKEVLLVNKYQADGSVSQRSVSLSSLKDIGKWLNQERLKIVFIKNLDPKKSIKIKVKCLIIPFSKADEGETQEWFSRVLGSPGGVGGNRRRQSSGQSSTNNLFITLLSTGIEHRSVRTYRWEWTLPPKGK